MKISRLLREQPHSPNLGLLLARITTGGLMCYLHGWSKLMAGTERWERLGSGLSDLLGLNFLSIPLGFMASFSESIAALCLIIGWYTRPSAFLLAFTMIVAVSKKIQKVFMKPNCLTFSLLIISIAFFWCRKMEY